MRKMKSLHFVRMLLLFEVIKLSYDPVCPSSVGCQLVCWSVCHNFLAEEEILLPSEHIFFKAQDKILFPFFLHTEYKV